MYLVFYTYYDMQVDKSFDTLEEALEYKNRKKDPYHYWVLKDVEGAYE